MLSVSRITCEYYDRLCFIEGEQCWSYFYCNVAMHRRGKYSNLGWWHIHSHEPALQPIYPKGQTYWREASRLAGLSYFSRHHWRQTLMAGSPPFTPGQQHTTGRFWVNYGGTFLRPADDPPMWCPGRDSNLGWAHTQVSQVSPPIM